jgi:mRNA interferase MazF
VTVAEAPRRGEVWLVNLDPIEGHEQGGRRPGLVVSVDQFNSGPAELVVLLPISSKAKGIPFHVTIVPPEGGLKRHSYIKCEDIRSVSSARLSRRYGHVSPETMDQVEDRLRILLAL